MVEAGDETVPARQGTDILLLHVRFLDDRLMAKHLVKSCLITLNSYPYVMFHKQVRL